MFRNSLRIISLLACLGFVSCTTSVDMPKGTSKGYSSARLTMLDPNRSYTTTATEDEVHRMIQSSLSANFTANGLKYGQSNADLVVAYMVVYQEPGMTTESTKYFGYNTDAEKITDIAHKRGVIDSKRPDFFRQAGIVVDIIDSKTNELVYRNFAKGDVVKGVSSATRAQRINAAVTQAVALLLQEVASLEIPTFPKLPDSGRVAFLWGRFTSFLQFIRWRHLFPPLL